MSDKEQPTTTISQVVTVLKGLVDHVRDLDDAGPCGETWQSKDLRDMIDDADAIIAKVVVGHGERTDDEYDTGRYPFDATIFDDPAPPAGLK